MGTLVNNISFFALFSEGLLSFFSPCVFPLIPIYISYLAGNGNAKTPVRKIVNSFFFIVGICATFYGLGFAATWLSSYKTIILPLGGTITFIYGLYQLDIFNDIAFLEKEYHLPFSLSKLQMSPIVALLLGLLFSFAWTPCVGPMLASAVLMAGTSDTISQSFWMITAYSSGFIVPFAVLSIADSSVMFFLKKHNSFLKITRKIGGVMLILVSFIMMTGLSNNFNIFFLNLTSKAADSNTIYSVKTEEDINSIYAEPDNASIAPKIWPDNVPDFELYDQYDNKHVLSDYLGKTIILNFWATWCPPCRAEMPEFEKVYSDYSDKDVVILGIVEPSSESDNIKKFMKANGCSYPALIDSDGTITNQYHITAFPTTYIINSSGDVTDTIIGMTSYDILTQYLS